MNINSCLQTVKKNNTPVRKNRLIKAVKESVQPYILLTPALVLFLLFSAYPMVWAIKYCLYDYSGYGSMPIYIGFDNFKRIFNFANFWGNSNSDTWLFWSSWGKTIIYSFIKIVIEIPVAMACAWLIHRKIKGAGFFRTLFYMPQILPSFVIFLVIGITLNPFNGFVNVLLSQIGIIPKNFVFFINAKVAFVTGIIIDIWYTFGINMLYLICALASIPTEVYESAEVDGASKRQAFIYITLPMMARMLQVIVMLALIGTLKAVGSYFILTAGGPNHATELTFLFIYYLFFPRDEISRQLYGYGAAVSLVSAVIIAFISLLYYKFSSKLNNT